MRKLLGAALGGAMVAVCAFSAPALAGDPREEAVAACRAAVTEAVGGADAEDVRLNRVDRREGAYQVRFRVRNAAGFRVVAQCSYDPASQQVTAINAPGAVQPVSAQAD